MSADIEKLEESVSRLKEFAEWVRDASTEELLTEAEDRANEVLEFIEEGMTGEVIL